MDENSIIVLLKLYNKRMIILEDLIKKSDSIIERHRYARDLRKLKEKTRLLEDEQRRLQGDSGG